MKPLTRAKKFLDAIYPLILVLTGVSIFIVGITSIVVLTKFANFQHAWLYHVAVVCVSITIAWWCFHFFYKGMKLLEQPKQKKNFKSRR